MNLFQEMEVNYKDFIESANDFIESCKEFKFQENGYGKGFFEGQMKERKYWKDKIKAKMKEKEWSLENYDCTEADYKQSQAIGAWSVLQSLLERREREVNQKCMK